MQSGSVRSSFAFGLIASVLLLSLGMNVPPALAQSHQHSASMRDGQPERPPVEKRLRSIIRKFISTILGEWDPPHP